MQDPQQPIVVSANENPNAIEVRFVNGPVDIATVIDRSTFLVRSSGGLAVGQITQTASNTVRWRARDPQTLPTGTYRVTLVGDGTPAILAQHGRRLDGEPNQLPSGNDVEGGNFDFILQVQ